MAMQDLQYTINRQQKKLTKYENKLREVITAYKSLLAEKEALEESLDALTGKNGEQDATTMAPANSGEQQQQVGVKGCSV
jgi:hypothetical protein